MSYSDNINKLLQLGNKDLKEVTKDYTKDVSDKVNKDNKMGQKQFNLDEPPSLPYPAQIDTQPNSEEVNSRYRTGQEVEVKNEELRDFYSAQILKVNFTGSGEETYDVRYADGEIEQQVPLSRIRGPYQGYVEQEVKTPESSTPISLQPFSPVSPGYNNSNSPGYVPNSPGYVANSPPYNPTSPPQQQQLQQQPIQIQITTPQATTPGILEVQPPPKEESKEESKDEKASSSSSETKQINISSNSSDTSSSSDSTKKITL
jgi:hypothetical protein